MSALDEVRAFAALVDLAVDQHTLVTIADADSVGVPVTQLRRWAAAGLLQRLSHGVYRVEAISGDRREHLQAALLWPGTDAVLVGGTALDLHDLSTLHVCAVQGRGGGSDTCKGSPTGAAVATAASTRHPYGVSDHG